IVKVTDTLGTAAVLVVAKEISIASAHYQFGSRCPVSAKAIERQRVDGAGITTETLWRRTGAGIDLADGAVRVGQRAGGARVGIVPARKHAQRIERLVVQAGVSVVLDERIAQRARRGAGAGNKRSCAARSVNGRNVTGKQPQLVLEDRAADLKARFEDGSHVF